jgi:glycosyltransferase involved in cell wall biosynthesis
MSKKEQFKKLKIAIVSDAVFPYNKGGKETRIHEISSRLVKLGHTVTIYCMNWKGLKKQESGVNLKAISNYYPLYAGDRRSMKEAIMFSLSCLKLLKEDFDVIDVDHMPHLVLFTTKLVSMLKRKPLYVTWNEVWGREYWVEYMGKLGNIAYIIEWITSRFPDKIIAVSEHTKTKLIKELKTRKPIVVIPNGIDLQAIKKVKPSKEKSDIIFAGRLLNHKNVDFMVKATSMLKKDFPKIKAFIIGKGPEKANLIELTDKLQLKENIKFFDFFTHHNEVYGLIKSSKVFIFPSTREGFGIVALEANACGVPVITTNHKDNAAKNLIQNGQNGYVVSLDSKKIAEKTKKYIKLKQRNTYNHIAEYDWSAITKKVEEVYK